MSIFLEIDTDLLRSTVASAEQTNMQITEAVNLLNRIVVHNDWLCEERNAINNNTINNQNTASRIQANSTAFYNAIKQSSEEFDAEEQNQILGINGVDDLLARVLNVVPNFISGETGIASNISIVDFSNISDSFFGK